MKRILLAAALAALGLACDKDKPSADPTPPSGEHLDERVGVSGRDPAEPAPAPPMFARDAAFETRTIDMMREMSGIVDKHKGDCAKMAAELRGFIQKNREALVAASDYSTKMDAPAREDFMTKNADAMKEISAKARAGATACGNDAEVQAALRDMPR